MVREQAAVAFSDAHAIGVPLRAEFAVSIDKGAPNTSSYVVLANLTAKMPDGTADMSVFSLTLVGERLTAFVSYTDADGNAASRKIFSSLTTIDRDVPYDVSLTTLVDSAGQGRLVLALNGTVVADYAGPLGFEAQESVSLSAGILRGANATETLGAIFTEPAFETGPSVVFPTATTFLEEPTIAFQSLVFADTLDATSPSASTESVAAPTFFVGTFTGTVAPGHLVELHADGVLYGTVVADEEGRFSAQIVFAKPGAHSLSAVAVDSSGARSIASYSVDLTIGAAGEMVPGQRGIFVLTTGRQTFEPAGAGQPWSIQALDANSLRFELRDDDRSSWDKSNWHGAERSEVSGSRHPYSDGTPIEVSYGFMIEAGEPNTAKWLVVGQLHQDLATTGAVASPPFEINLVGERLAVTIHYGSTDAPISKVLYLDTSDIVRGHLYEMKIAVVFDAAGGGHLTVERDGMTIVDYAGPIGYIEQNGVYWAEGIYRADGAAETIAVQYRDLDIKTGAGVTFAEAGSFVAAPVLDVASAVVSDDGSALLTHLAGTAGAGSIVTIFQNGVAIGTAVADAAGVFSLDVTTAAAGRQDFSASAVSAAGHHGLTSTPHVVLTMTAADVVARLGSLSSIAGLDAIVLTGSHTLDLTTTSQLNAALGRDAEALSGILGGHTLVYTQTVSGKSYDTAVFTYDSNGKVVEVDRYAGTKLVYRDSTADDGSHVVRMFDAKDIETRTVLSATYQRLSSETFDAQHHRIGAWELGADGSQTTRTYSASTGVETRTTVIFADKSKVETLSHIEGKAYASQVSHFDAANKIQSVERITAGGVTILSQVWHSEGSSLSRFFTSSGVETSSMLTLADGSRTATTFGFVGRTYASEAVHYDASNRLDGIERFDSQGLRVAAEMVRADGSKLVYALDANGLATGYTLTGIDLSRELVVFTQAGSARIASSSLYDAKGHLLERSTFDESDHLATREVWAKDGARTFTTYADPTHVVATSYDAANHLVARTILDGAGARLSTTNFQSDGTRVVHTFDAATGDELRVLTLRADGSRTDAGFHLDRAGYTSQTISYDAAGKNFETIRWLGDKMVLWTSHNTDGSETLRVWDAAGAESIRVRNADGTSLSTDINAAGVTVRSASVAADGSRETYSFDGQTGLKTAFSILHADGSKDTGRVASATAAYDTQFEHFDASGRLVSVDRYATDGSRATALAEGHLGVLVQSMHYGTDGSADLLGYSRSGQIVSHVETGADGAKTASVFTYASLDAPVPTEVRSDHWNAAGERILIDVTKADGSHVVTSRVAGQTVVSQEGVSDLFALAGGDVFVFGAHSGHDRIVGFHAGDGPAHDTIQISSDVATQFSELNLYQAGHDVVVALSANDTITLSNVSLAHLTADDFNFV